MHYSVLAAHYSQSDLCSAKHHSWVTTFSLRRNSIVPRVPAPCNNIAMQIVSTEKRLRLLRRGYNKYRSNEKVIEFAYVVSYPDVFHQLSNSNMSERNPPKND